MKAEPIILNGSRVSISTVAGVSHLMGDNITRLEFGVFTLH